MCRKDCDNIIFEIFFYMNGKFLLRNRFSLIDQVVICLVPHQVNFIYTTFLEMLHL